jgi:hypothetical protein
MHLLLVDVDAVLQLQDVEVLVGGEAALVTVVELLAARFNLLDQSLQITETKNSNGYVCMYLCTRPDLLTITFVLIYVCRYILHKIWHYY